MSLPEDRVLVAEVGAFTVSAYLTGSTTFLRSDRAVARKTEENYVAFDIASKSGPRAFDAFDDITMAIRDLITLGSDEPCEILATTLNHVDRLEFTGETTPEIPRRVKMRGGRRRTAATHSNQLPHQYAFTCEDADFAALLPRWVELRSRAGAACEVLFGISRAEPPPLELQLLQVAIAAEAMHFALYNHDRIDPEEFAQWMTVLKDHSPADRHEWLRGVIRNDQSFPARLRELASKPDQDAVKSLIPNRAKWCGRLVEARNSIAHTATRTTSDLNTLNDSVATEYLLKLVLMSELGIGADRQRYIVEDGRATRYILEREDAVPEATSGD